MGFRKMPPVWAFLFKDRFFVGRYRMSVAEIVFLAQLASGIGFGFYKLYEHFAPLYIDS